ncbi:hypothetical protein [Aquimarina longa]|uniref:hypothetical protein n=1 Tax=Aquimarina longa TaxID=1080221 RepID=UPI0009E90391|nr:hypothetical protein [Aquimarina longa]
MNTRKFLSILTITGSILFMSCSNDDDNPKPVNEEELITKMSVSLVGGGQTINLVVVDKDGEEGPSKPEVTVSGKLKVNTQYSGSIELLNESKNPVDVISDEVKKEADEHQFFYVLASGLNITAAYADKESDYKKEDGTAFTSANPVGLKFLLTTTNAGTGTFRITLRHKPKKDAEGVVKGDITNAGGDTDIDQTFNITIE